MRIYVYISLMKNTRKSQWENDAKLAQREREARKKEEEEKEKKRYLFCTTDRINGYLNADQSC